MDVLSEVHDKKENAFKILNDVSSLPDTDVLQKPQTRKSTDVLFLYVFAACILLLIPFLIYTFYYSDINRLKGYDDCGNICGQKNIKNDMWNCTGRDLTLTPVHGYKSCMEDKYPEYWSYRASSDGKATLTFIHRSMWKLLLLSFVPLTLCLILILLFHYFPAVAVWSVLITSWLVFTTVGLLHFLNSYYLSHIVPVSVFCIISLFLLLWIVFHLNNIRLASELLKEATRPLFEMKKMCYISLGALSTSEIVVLSFTTIYFITMTAGKLGYYKDYVEYLPDGGMITAMILNTVVAIWTILVIFGVQDMTVSGTVAQWYTTRNEDDLKDAVFSNFCFVTINHLGTIVLGSLLMVIMSIPRLILHSLVLFSFLKQKADAWLRCLDGYFTNYSYIITAMCGTTFLQSGRQASKLLKLSIGNTRDLNSVVNSVIIVAQCLIVFVCTVVAYNVLHYRLESHALYADYFTNVACGMAGLCSYAFLGTLKVSSDTLFFCVTVELLKTKEVDQPITTTMKELVEDCNKLYLQEIQNRPASNMPEKIFHVQLLLSIVISVSSVLLFVAYVI